MKFFTPENSTLPPPPSKPTNVSAPEPKPILFEKSATYFDNEMVPRRAHALLPRSKIVSVI